MANLKTFSGFPIQNLSSDPVPYAQALIDDPYVGAWSSGGNLNTGRNDLAGSGTLTAGLAFGGNPATGKTEKYNGTSWTEVNDLNTARRALTGFGVQTASIAAFGGENPYNNEAEQFDGTNWTEIAEVNTAGGGQPGSCGTTTAGLVFGRRKAPGATKGGETEGLGSPGNGGGPTGRSDDVPP